MLFVATRQIGSVLHAHLVRLPRHTWPQIWWVSDYTDARREWRESETLMGRSNSTVVARARDQQTTQGTGATLELAVIHEHEGCCFL